MWRTWLQSHAAVLGWLGFFSLLMFVGTLIMLPVLIARLPSDYFARKPDAVRHRSRAHPAWHLFGHLLKNALGLLLLTVGIAMLILPGQGLLTMLLGLTLLEFPGKRALEWRLVQRPMIWHALNWIRARAQQPPLQWPDGTAAPPASKSPNQKP